jgi:GMP reductase
MRIEEDTKLDYNDVLLKPKRSTLSSRADVTLERTFIFSDSIDEPYTCIPIIAANMDTTGTFETAQAFSDYKMNVALHKHYTVEELHNHFRYGYPGRHSWYTMGVTKDDYAKFNQFKELMGGKSHWSGRLCIDVANGYTERFANYVKQIREENPTCVIMAGNVVTAEMTETLILAGANIVKVGIGSGSACYTRLMSGVGYPQLSAINECADAAHGLGGFICADGGCVTPGDVAKSFAAGADFSMLGGMLAGHDESGGDLIEENGKKYKLFYGMSSEKAMNKHNGGVAKHRASEGRTIKLPYKGPIDGTIQNILGGVRSACTYIGAGRIKDMPKCATFIKVNNQLNTTFENITIGN